MQRHMSRTPETLIALAITTLLVPVMSGQTPASLTVDLGRTKSPGQPDSVRPDDGRDQLLLRRRPVRGAGPQPHLPVRLERHSQLVPGRERDRHPRRSASMPRTGPSTALTNSAKLEVTKADANSPAGLLNEGYWGIAVRPNTRYTGSFFAKSGSDGALPVKVALVADQSGQVLASASVAGRRDGVEGVQVRDAVRKRRRVLREPPRADHRQARDPVAAAGLAVPADLSRPAQRQPHRHHGEAGRHASHVPALPRRQLPRRRPHRRRASIGRR